LEIVKTQGGLTQQQLDEIGRRLTKNKSKLDAALSDAEPTTKG